MKIAEKYGLNAKQIEEFGQELDHVRNEVMAARGQGDAAYIRKLIKVQRSLAAIGRLTIYASFFFHPKAPLAISSHTWTVFAVLIVMGTLTLAVAKVLANMEIGHNVMHGQWDWMRDPEIQSSSWQWDSACPADDWKHSHNIVHHTWTNVMGRDNDIGYGILRIFPEQKWEPRFIFQPVYVLHLAMLFDWAVAVHDLEMHKIISREKPLSALRPRLGKVGKQFRSQLRKDFLLYPLLAGPFFFYVVAANLLANLLRNLWLFMMIFCGHFPAKAQIFSEDSVINESRGQWYLRQLLGSCNIQGGRMFHVLSGNLGFQIEHHLFPDMPSNRYQEVAPRIREIAARYGIPYNTGSLSRQLGSTLGKILRHSLPSMTQDDATMSPRKAA